MTLFDAAPGAGPEPEVRRVSLVRLSALIAQAAASVGRVAVEGEVHRPQRGRTGRLWFTLRDRASQVSVSVPPARQARCRVVAGERVSVVGRLEWVNEWGQLQLLAEEIIPVGEGAMAAAIAEARRRLELDGLIQRPRRALPMLPTAVGVVCGHEAAVRADIESVVAARFPGFPVVFFETTVSGPGAVDNIVAGIAALDGRPEIEVIILARGGGDAAQLLPFSDEAVCRSVCRSLTPVVAAIGHEGDRPLVDEVADLRCGTPSLAASAVIPDRAALVAGLDAAVATARMWLKRRLAVSERALDVVDGAATLSRRLQWAEASLARASGRLAAGDPIGRLRSCSVRLERVDASATARSRVATAALVLEGLRRESEVLSPAGVLRRGYAVVRSSHGGVVRDASSVGLGERITVQVAVGRMAATVEEVEEVEVVEVVEAVDG